MAQLITIKNPKCGPDNNSTACMHIYIYIYLSLSLSAYVCVFCCALAVQGGQAGGEQLGQFGTKHLARLRRDVDGGGRRCWEGRRALDVRHRFES